MILLKTTTIEPVTYYEESETHHMIDDADYKEVFGQPQQIITPVR